MNSSKNKSSHVTGNGRPLTEQIADFAIRTLIERNEPATEYPSAPDTAATEEIRNMRRIAHADLVRLHEMLNPHPSRVDRPLAAFLGRHAGILPENEGKPIGGIAATLPAVPPTSFRPASGATPTRPAQNFVMRRVS